MAEWISGEKKLMEMLEAAHKSCCVPTFFSMAEAYKLIFMQMADYLIAHGAIIPPCKVGDKVYVLVKTVSAEKKESSIVILESIAVGREERLNDRTRWELEIYISDQLGEKTYVKPISLSEEEFGNTVFLSREEAEKALEGVE